MSNVDFASDQHHARALCRSCGQQRQCARADDRRPGVPDDLLDGHQRRHGRRADDYVDRRDHRVAERQFRRSGCRRARVSTRTPAGWPRARATRRRRPCRCRRDSPGVITCSSRPTSGNVVFENGSKANNVGEAPNNFDVMPIPYADLVVSSIVDPAARRQRPAGQRHLDGHQPGDRPDERAELGRRPGAGQRSGRQEHHRRLRPVQSPRPDRPGGSYVRTGQVTLPDGLSGTYYFVVTAAAHECAVRVHLRQRHRQHHGLGAVHDQSHAAAGPHGHERQRADHGGGGEHDPGGLDRAERRARGPRLARGKTRS